MLNREKEIGNERKGMRERQLERRKRGREKVL